MALVFKDRVKVTSTTAGTGTFTLGSAVTGFQDFSVIGDGNTTYYTITDDAGNWEVGLGTYTTSGTTLARTTVLESSNSNNAVDFSAGTKTVFVTFPADKAQSAGGPVGATAWVVGQNSSTFSNGNWLLCDGSIYNQSSYPDLYTVIGDVPNSFGTAPSVTSGTASSLYATTYGNSLFVMGGATGNLRTSTDAVTWTARTSGTTSQINSLVYGNGLYVYATIGGGISTSTDAITWTARTSGTTSDLNRLLYANNLYIAAGAGGNLRTSTDAITWTSRTSSTTRPIYGLTYGNNTYVYVAGNGVYGTSTDAITWSTSTIGTTSSIYGVAYGNNTFLMVGNIAGGGSFCVSTKDLTTLTVTTIEASYNMRDIQYGNGIFLTCGGTSVANTYITVDGIKFKSQPVASNANDAYSVAYGNKAWIIAKSAGTANKWTPYTYNANTQFAVPNKNIAIETFTNQYSYSYNLYIKAK